MMRLLQFINLMGLLFSPDDASGNAGSGTLDTIDLLGEDDKAEGESAEEDAGEEEKEEESKEEDSGEEEEEELKLEDDEDEKGLDDEELELALPVRKKEILKKYPNLEKDFPALFRSYYRDGQFVEIFGGGVKEARAVKERAEILDRVEADVLGGNIEGVLKAAYDNDKNAFNKITDNYLETLSKVNESAYYHVVGNVVKRAVASLYAKGEELQNDDLKQAALLVNQHVFGTSKYEPPTKLSKEETKVDNSLNEERQKFEREKFETAFTDLTERVDNTIRNTVLDHIDKNGQMSNYVKNKATQDVLDTVENLISRDMQFRRFLDSKWDDAKKDNYSRSSLDKIRSAYLAKVKTVLPDVIKKTRADALKDASNTRRNPDKDRKGPLPMQRNSASSNNRGQREAKPIPKGMKSIDYLMQD